MLYAASFLISAITFALLAKGETEPWARDDPRSEKKANDGGESKELMEIASQRAVPGDPKV